MAGPDNSDPSTEPVQPTDPVPPTDSGQPLHGKKGWKGSSPRPASSSPRTSLYAAIVVVMFAVLFALGFVVGRSGTSPSAAELRTAMSERNEVWGMLNDIDNATLDTPVKVVGGIVGMMLGPEMGQEGRNVGLKVFMIKSFRAFPEAQAAQLQRLIADGTPEQVAGFLKAIVELDQRSDELLASVLADKDRIDRYMRHELPIPLEKMPDGTTP
jgi:hypothetical protein